MVTFCGGEPLLVPKISEYAATFRQHGKSAVLNTNGELLRSRIADTRPGWEFRLADFAMVGISIDGSTPEVHRLMRENANLDEVLAAARLVAKEPSVGLKIATVVSSVNRGDLSKLAEKVQELNPKIWRLYQYSSRGSYNRGRERHPLPDDEFRELAEEAESLVDPIPTAPSTEAQTEGCLIVDPAGNVLEPKGDTYAQRGNCLEESLDRIWSKIPTQSTIINNKRWLYVLS